SPLELLLGAATAHGQSAPAKYPTAPQPGHHVNSAAHRTNLAVRHLKTIGYQASGLMSDEELVKAVGAETRRHHYDEHILAAGSQGGGRLARSLRLDPIHQLRRKVQRLVILPPGQGAKPGQETKTEDDQPRPAASRFG